MKLKLKRSIQLTSFILSAIPALSMANTVTFELLGGADFQDQENTQYVTTDPSYQNQYITDPQHSPAAWAGIGVGYQWDRASAPMSVNLGLMAGYTENSLSGTTSAIVGGSSFNTLSYSMRQKSFSLMLEPKLIYTAKTWQPYCFLGLGAALNTLSNFNETEASPGGGIAPPANQFHDHSELSLAYEFGLGVQRQFLSKPHQNLFLALEYRYLNWGKMGLSAADLQPTANAIQYNSSPGHLFDLGLIWQFK